MTAPNPALILRNPGRLAIGVTSLAIPYPHGGTALGTVRAVEVLPNVAYATVTAEEYGGERVEDLFVGESWVLTAVLRDWDPDVVTRVFPNASIGTASQHGVVTGPGALRPGHLLSGRAVVLAFSPDAPDTPGLVFHRAIPILGEEVSIPFAHADPFELLVAFAALRSAAGKAYSLGRLQDIVL